MLEGDVNPFPIQLLFNYWEKPLSSVGFELDGMMKSGVTQLATFVPWQAVENDVFHTLPRFLLAAADRQITVTLILSPEVGVPLPQLGLPKDVLTKAEAQGRTQKGRPFFQVLPPQAAPLPTLFSAELTQRYFGFLNRLDGVLAELIKSNPQVGSKLRVSFTGSYWKYYRSTQEASLRTYGSLCGDFSTAAMTAFRQHQDRFFAQAEFQIPTAASSQRWKTRAFEEINQRHFFQSAEDSFRIRSQVVFRKRAMGVPTTQIELFTPEADPALAPHSIMTHLLQVKSHGTSALARVLRESLNRGTATGSHENHPWVSWTETGLFARLSDSEKQMLLIQSLVLAGAQGGGVFVSASDWFSWSKGFRNRMEVLANLLSRGSLKKTRRVCYLTSHVWSSQSTLWEELNEKAHSWSQCVASVELAVQDSDTRLIVVDPSYIFTEDRMSRLMHWAQQAGRVLVLPKSPLYSELARNELEPLLEQKALELELGVSYRVFPLGGGQVVMFDLPEGIVFGGELKQAWKQFAQGMLALAEISRPAQLEEKDCEMILLERKKLGSHALFLFNPTKVRTELNLHFDRKNQLFDFFQSLSGAETQGMQVSSISLEVGAFGAISLAAKPESESPSHVSQPCEKILEVTR